MRPLLLLVLLTLVASGEASAATQPGDRGRSIAWQLSDVSDDGRTVSVFHEEPHCETVPGRAEVTQDAARVRVRVPVLRRELPADAVCTADLRFTTTRVRLRAPLGARRLEQPGGRPLRFAQGPGQRCPRILRARADAPLLDVPLFARERARCLRPVPATVLAFPLLRRAPSAPDRLSRFEQQDLALERTYLQRALARGAPLPGGSVVMVPGAEGSCAFFRAPGFGGRECASTRQLVRRGLFAQAFVDPCASARVRGVVRVAGIAPAGAATARLVRGGKTVADVPVRDGVYALSAFGATGLVVAGARLPLERASSEC